MNRVRGLNGAPGVLARPRRCLCRRGTGEDARAGRHGPTKLIVSNARQRTLIIRVMSSPYESYFELHNLRVDRCDSSLLDLLFLRVVRVGALAREGRCG